MKSKSGGVIIIQLLLLSILASCSSNENHQSESKALIKEQVKSRIDNGFSVGTVVVFLENGKEEYFAYGFSDTTHSKPITKKSVFEIGSITKTFTSLILADLVEKGQINLDDPIEKYLPDSVKAPTRGNHKVTFADLATHTSGLPRMPDNFNPGNAADPFADYGVDELYAYLNNYQSKSSDNKMEYSNLGVGLLGHTLEVITGKKYEQLLQEVICKPFNMGETSTLNSSEFLTTGHTGTRAVAHWNLDALVGAGGIRSSGEDMLRYLKAQMGMTPTNLKPAIGLTHKPLHDVMPGVKIGLGWFIHQINGDEVITHGGGTGGYRTFAAFSNKSKKAIIILNNSTHSNDDIGMYFFNPRAKIAPIKQPANISADILKSYTGKYRVQKDNDLLGAGTEFDVKVEGNHLIVKLADQPYIPVYPENATHFFCREVDASVGFFKSASGKVDRLVLYQMGMEASAAKQ